VGWWVGGLFNRYNKATLSQQSWSWGLAELGNIICVFCLN
jgi:hypothetical protein